MSWLLIVWLTEGGGVPYTEDGKYIAFTRGQPVPPITVLARFDNEQGCTNSRDEWRASRSGLFDGMCLSIGDGAYVDADVQEFIP